MLPFGGTFDLVQLSGATLRKVFEFSVRRYGSGTGEFLQVSGTSSYSSSFSSSYASSSFSSPPHLHHLHTLMSAVFGTQDGEGLQKGKGLKRGGG